MKDADCENPDIQDAIKPWRRTAGVQLPPHLSLPHAPPPSNACGQRDRKSQPPSNHYIRLKPAHSSSSSWRGCSSRPRARDQYGLIINDVRFIGRKTLFQAHQTVLSDLRWTRWCRYHTFGRYDGVSLSYPRHGWQKNKILNSGASISVHLHTINSRIADRTRRPRKVSLRIRHLAQSIHVYPPKTRQETGKTTGGGTREKEKEADGSRRRFWTKEGCQ